MIWEEVLVDHSLTFNEIADTLSKLFSVSPANILVIDDIAKVSVNKHVRILCERMQIKGDFSIRLSIYLRDPDLEQLESKVIIGQFCDILHCKCLMSDESLNPFSWLLVQGSSNIQAVFLNPDKFEKEEYVIEKSATD
ncbi:MAG: hypothetical protein ACMUIU_01555 [bacterium]